MDSKNFLEAWKKYAEKELYKNCHSCKNSGTSSTGKVCCKNLQAMIDCMIEKIEAVEKWQKQHPVIELTEQQKTAIKGRIAEGYLWVSKYREYDNDNSIWFYSENPEKDFPVFFESRSNSKIYDFVAKENSPIYLPDLLKENN